MSLKIAHFSDLHLNAPPETWRVILDKRLIGLANGTLIRGGYHRERIMPAIRDILNWHPDVAVFTGDAVTCMQKREFEKTVELLSPLTDAKIPLIWTPGNHDRYVNDKICVSAFEKAYYRLTGRSLHEFPYSMDTGEFRFLVFDSALPRNLLLSDGIFSEDSTAFLEKNLDCGKRLIAVSHFPVLKSETAGFRRSLKHAEKLVRAVREQKIEFVLSGHDHKPYAVLDRNTFGESCCGSLTKYGTYDRIEADNRYSIQQIHVQQD